MHSEFDMILLSNAYMTLGYFSLYINTNMQLPGCTCIDNVAELVNVHVGLILPSSVYHGPFVYNAFFNIK